MTSSKELAPFCLQPIWLSGGLRRVTYIGVIPAQAGIQRAKRKTKLDTGFRRYDHRGRI
jgi:hypothetical protein